MSFAAPTWAELSAMKPAQVRAVAQVLGVLTPNGKPTGSVERVWDAITAPADAARAALATRIQAQARAANPEVFEPHARIERTISDRCVRYGVRMVTGPTGEIGLMSAPRYVTPAAARAAIIAEGFPTERIIDASATPCHAERLTAHRHAYRTQLHKGARRLGVAITAHSPMWQIKAAYRAGAQ